MSNWLVHFQAKMRKNDQKYFEGYSLGMVRILHKSDIHFRKASNWDRQPVVDALCAVLKELPNPDLVALSGDLAFSGKASEYKLAEAWLRDTLWLL